MITRLLARVLIGIAFLAVALPGCSPSGESPSLSDPDKSSGEGSGGRADNQESSSPDLNFWFITNNASEFWKIAEAGVNKALEENPDVSCEVRVPPNGTPAEQKQLIEEAIALQLDGIAVSVIDPSSQIGVIDEAVERGLIVLTQDSDAPESKRLAFIGTNNYAAGRKAGEAIKKALPEGGKIWLFVGKADAQNAIDRRRGIEDVLRGTNITIVDQRTDDVDRQRAKANAEDVIASNQDVAALVGLWAYNGPAILNAVRSAEKLGEIQIIAFDEEDATLQGVADGHIFATVVQQPYEFGYQSVKILKAVAGGDRSGIPEDGLIEIPTQLIQQGEAAAYLEKIKKLQGRE